MSRHPLPAALGLALALALALPAPAQPAQAEATEVPASPPVDAAASPGEAAATDLPPAGPATGEDTEASAGAKAEGTEADPATGTVAVPGLDNGLAIFERFRAGLAEPQCAPRHDRWHRHFAHAPARLADPGSDALPLFAHVVDALRQAHLPTEFALIPFIESGYSPAARGKGGPAGLWQFIGGTARNHGIHVNNHYDGRLSPADSTRAAVRYLKTLNGMFGGNWRLTAMAYNAGENRVLQALRRSGSAATEATPAHLDGLSPVTYAYVDKLHALACVLEQAGEREDWRAGLDRPVLRLEAVELEGASNLDAWAARNDAEPGLLHRLNPSLAGGRWPRGLAPLALVPSPLARGDSEGAQSLWGLARKAGDAEPAPAPVPAPAARDATRSHTVRQGESAWSIARRHGIPLERLLRLNRLGRDAVLRPGMKLRLD